MSLSDAQQLFGFFFAIYFYMIIDRSHVMYRSWDTYSAWRGITPHVNRLVAGWVLLAILPVTQFAILFTLLGIFNVSFDTSLTSVVRIILISTSSFFTFGYFRLYEALVHSYPQSFFSEGELSGGLMTVRPHIRAHFIPGILYVTLSTILLLLTLYI